MCTFSVLSKIPFKKNGENEDSYQISPTSKSDQEFEIWEEISV